MVVERVRPDGTNYFIKADTFDGWKEDYVFTTKAGRGTGYFWDGMDSVKKLLQGGGSTLEEATDWNGGTSGATAAAGDRDLKRRKKKKKSKKNKRTKMEGSATTMTIQPEDHHHQQHQTDSHNPMEQVQNAIRRRNEILSRSSSILGVNPTTTTQADHERTEMNALTGTTTSRSRTGTTTTSSSSKTPIVAATKDDNLPSSSSSSAADASVVAELASHGWEVATDTGSGKLYYFARSTGERRWDAPLFGGSRGSDGDVTSDVGGKSSLLDSSLVASSPPLVDGWSKARDPTSGRDYYYHAASKKTSWHLPT